MGTRALRAWCGVHKWSSLVCTLFLLWLCITGLPLIFHHEIGEIGEAAPSPGFGASHATFEQVVASARARHPGNVVQYLSWDPHEPERLTVVLAPTADAEPDAAHVVAVDARSAQVLEAGIGHEIVEVLFRLHVDLYAGLPGKLFLGAMGLAFAVSVISGIVVYGPFMRRLAFGAVRRDRSPRVKWLDLHNLLGIVTVAWALVVGLTGVLNTWADLVIQIWRADQLTAMVAPYRDKPPPGELIPVDRAVAAAALPGMSPAFVAFPGTLFSSKHHYAVFLRGETPLTSRLVKPALIDATTGELTATAALPWYVTALLISQPLHFGDYGGLPLQLIWALLDLVTIVVLGSGLYLWLRRGSSIEARLAVLAEA